MLTPLAQRLGQAARYPEVDWRVLVENVPVWPSAPPRPALRWTDGDDHYSDSRGTAQLLAALCARDRARGVDVDMNSIIVTNGGFDALGLTLRHLADTGARRVVCAGPILLSVSVLCRLAGLETLVMDWSELLAEGGWRSMGLGPEDIVYVNTPHNPTGACLGEAQTQALLQDQQRRGFHLVLDLVYDSFQYGTDIPRPPSALVEDWHSVYAFNSFSKNYGAPGLRVGWLTAERGAVEDVAARLEAERISVSGAAQLHAASLCAHGNQALVDQVGTGRALVSAWAEENHIEVILGQGGTQALLRLPVDDVETYADKLMAQEHLVLATGSNYLPVQERCIRIPTGGRHDLLRDALDVIRHSLDRTATG